MILHHYALSPFSEKMRAMLGTANLPWQSCITRELPPRPVLAALAGGYRKIPVAQIGADIFCDTRVIASEIAALSGMPQLALESADDATQAYANATDLHAFMDVLAASATMTAARKMLATMSVRDFIGFFVDRIRIGAKAKVKAGNPRQAKQRVLAHLAATEQRLQQQPYLFGPQATYADFSTYHSLWMARDVAEWPALKSYPLVMAWMDRLQAVGQGQRTEISAEQTLKIARDATPRAIASEHQQDARIGQRVGIAPSDYARDATIGRLVGVTPARWIIARETPDLGTLHVHFPQTGFVLRVLSET
ncbi:MAG: glutathione S-transferase family protein [Pseudomonadota bacterium]